MAYLVSRQIEIADNTKDADLRRRSQAHLVNQAYTEITSIQSEHQILAALGFHQRGSH